MWAPRRTWLLALGLLGAVAPAHAAERTDVIDAADEDDPYDFNAEVTYRRSLRRAKITREFNFDCTRTQCPEDAVQVGGGALVHVKELRYERVIHEIVPTLRFGIWHDLELSIDAPIVLSDDQSLRFAGNGGKKSSPVVGPTEIKEGDRVVQAESTVAPGPRLVSGVQQDPENLFSVPYEGEPGVDLPTRAGFGDMLFMLRWSPFAQDRDPSRATWTLEGGWRAPTGEPMAVDNEGVGRGVHELIFGTALSRRYQYLDPYASFEAVFPFPANDSLFKDYGDSQEHVGPGPRLGFDFGAEIVPYEDPAKQVKVYIDVGLGAVYHAEGRDYSELFDALARGALECDPNGVGGATNCGRYTGDSRSEIAGEPHDGITTVEQFMTFKGRLGLGVQASKYLRIGAEVALAHDTEHFISNAEVGKDKDGSGLVENRSDPNYDPAEQNPTYVPAIDAVGRRLRVEETTVFSVGFNAAVMF
jgi:hypothetical protein